MTERPRIQAVIGGLYSWAAPRVYEPVVVKGAFRLFGGKLNELAFDQGRRAVGTAAGRPILDVPAGTGYFAGAAARAHPGIVAGADFAWGMVRATRRRAIAGLVPVQADVHHLPFRSGAFAAILCTNGLQVIPGLTGAVRELARVLGPGGTVYVSVLLASLGSLPPARAGRRLPTVLRGGAAVAAEFESAGLTVTGYRHVRFAHLFEAVKT